MKTLMYSLCIGVVCLGIADSSVFAQEVIEKSFNGIEVLEMDIGGVDVVYTGVAGLEELKLSAQFGKNDDAAKNFFMVTLGNTLKLSYKNRGNNVSMNNEKKFIHMEGPTNIRIVGKNSSGLLAVKGVNASETKLTINSGMIRAQQINGSLVLKGNSGKIEARQVDGDLSCSISSGKAELESISGNVVLSANSGSLKAKDIKGKVDAKLTSGNMNLDNIGELGQVTVSSGSAKIRKVALGTSTYLQGSSGSIDVQTHSDLQHFNYELRAGSGLLRVGNISESKNLVIENGAPTTIKGSISSGSLQIKTL